METRVTLELLTMSINHSHLIKQLLFKHVFLCITATRNAVLSFCAVLVDLFSCGFFWHKNTCHYSLVLLLTTARDIWKAYWVLRWPLRQCSTFHGTTTQVHCSNCLIIYRLMSGLRLSFQIRLVSWIHLVLFFF